MECNLNFFTNDRYKIIYLLFVNQVKVKKDLYIPLCQQEIADIAHFSKGKTNKILNELIETGCIILFQNKRGKYALTDKANKIIKLVEKTSL